MQSGHIHGRYYTTIGLIDQIKPAFWIIFLHAYFQYFEQRLLRNGSDNKFHAQRFIFLWRQRFRNQTGVKRVTITSNNTKAGDFLILYIIEYDVFITKEPVIDD